VKYQVGVEKNKMSTKGKQWDFCFAYSFAARVVSAIEIPDEEEYLIDFIDPGSTEFLRKVSLPQKDTLLHDLIRNLNYSDWEWIVQHGSDEVSNELRQLVIGAEISVPAWLQQGRVDEHLSEAYELVERAAGSIAEATFHLLFADRCFLINFQRILSSHVSTMRAEDYPAIMEKDGVIKRPPSLPNWLRSAVFHRDKGRCQLCFRDLTGLITPQYEREIQLDHMVPLNISGTNDPTNFQLVCQSCNTRKKDKYLVEKPFTFPYW
jgi:hypothetical protein